MIRRLLPITLICLMTPTLAWGGIAVDPDKKNGAAACAHLTQLWAIENRASTDLARGKIQIRCGPLHTQRGVRRRELRVLRTSEHEAMAWLDRITGRLWGLDVQLLPTPPVSRPKKGWPSYQAIEESVRHEAGLSAEARLKHIERIFDAKGGLLPGQHPYAQLVFEHVVEGATVLGDRIVARFNMRKGRLVQLTARPWHPAVAPDRRVTLSRARRVARKMLRRIKPIDVPCCQPTKTGLAADDAIGKAMSTDVSVDKVEQRRLRRLMRRARVTCPDLQERRIFAPDVQGRLKEAWQFRCVPVCQIAKERRRCKESEAAMVYVTTERGRTMGMKGLLAPPKQNWKPGLPPSPLPMRDPVLERKARIALRRSITGLDPHAEFQETSCSEDHLGARIYRLCWSVAFTAETWMAHVEGMKVSFIATSKSALDPRRARRQNVILPPTDWRQRRRDL